MPLNIKNEEVERLVSELAAATGESKTETVRQALEAHRGRIATKRKARKIESFLRYLQEEVWPEVPPDLLGMPLTKEEREEILGYGEDGV